MATDNLNYPHNLTIMLIVKNPKYYCFKITFFFMNNIFTCYIQYLTEIHFFLFFSILLSYVLFSFILNNDLNTKFHQSLVKTLKVIFIIFIIITIIMLLLSLNTTINCDDLNDSFSKFANILTGIQGSTVQSNNTPFPDLFINSPFEFSILNFNWLPIDLSNPILVVLFSIFILNLVSLMLLFLLTISLLGRFFYNKDNKSLWVDSFFSHKFFGIKFKSFIKLLIKMYGKANLTNIVIIIFILIIALLASNYLLFQILINFPLIVKIYLANF